MSKLPKIAVVDPVGAKAGMDYYNKNLLEGFCANGAQCFLFSNSESQNNVHFESVKTFNLFSNGLFVKVSNQIIGHLRSAVLCRRRKIDIVILHVFSANMGSLAGFLVTRIFGLNILAIVHDVESFADDDSNFAKRKIYGSLTRWISVHNERSLALIREFCAAHNVKTSIYVAEHGGFTNQSDPSVSKESARQSLGLDATVKYGLFFGQIKKTKGLDTLIKSLANQTANFKLIIAGKPWKSTFDDYQILIDENGAENLIEKHIRYIEDHEREEFFKAADFVVLPYREIYQSGVLLMAMSYGLPVVATDIEGFSTIINEADSGLLFPVGDSKALANAISRLVFSDDLVKRLGANARHAVDTKYNWQNIAATHLSHLSK